MVGRLLVSLSVGGAQGDDRAIIQQLPLFPSDTARRWLEELPANQIHDWFDLVRVFEGNFKGTYIRPGNSWDLSKCKQKSGETDTDPRRQGSAESHGMFGGTKSFYLKVGRKGIATVSALEKAERFSWTPEAEEALDNLKETLTSAPVLVPPQPAKPLLLYVASTTQVVSAAVVVERQEEGHALPVQRPIYFVSEVLSETKARYPQIQKLIYAVILARRKLQHYFLGHPITVVSVTEPSNYKNSSELATTEVVKPMDLNPYNPVVRQNLKRPRFNQHTTKIVHDQASPSQITTLIAEHSFTSHQSLKEVITNHSSSGNKVVLKQHQ